jgi:class 3 adenylate cyclase
VGARLAEHAEPGEVLVSEEAMRIAARRGITFTYRGAASLKGLPAERRLFAVSGLPVTANVVA